MSVINISDVVAETNLSKSTILRKIKAGDFPASIKLSDRRIGWRRADVIAWIEARTAA